MPSHRKRIGFLPSEEVHEIIEKISSANNYSQSKVTGLLVEEALKSRGMLEKDVTEILDGNVFRSNNLNASNKQIINNYSNNLNLKNSNKKNFEEDLKMINEYIDFKFFKNVMKKNNINFDS